MKRFIKYFIIALVLLLPFGVNAKQNVSITSVTPLGTNSAYDLFETPTFSGLTININGSFINVGDAVSYKVAIKNDDNEDYTFSDYKDGGTSFPSIDYSKSEYISYSLYCEDGYLLKAKSTKECNLVISYIKAVPSELLQATGGFSESNQVKIGIGNDKGNLISKLSNPNTASTIATILILLVIIMTISMLLIVKKKKKVGLLALVLGISTIPISVFAATLLTITINSTVVISDGVGSISNNPSFCYLNDQGEYSLHEYEAGMTWATYLSSAYNTENFMVEFENPLTGANPVAGNYKYINRRISPQNYTGTGSFSYLIDNELELIVPLDQSCYCYNESVA